MKALLFDLDGVLVSAKQIHFSALNTALERIDKKYIITENEHLSIFDGLKTKEKLSLLTQIKGLPENKHDQIWIDKQQITLQKIEELKKDENLIKTISYFYNKGYKIACCSNSIKQSIIKILKNIGIIDFFHLILSNEDVENSKPHPQIYWDAMIEFNLNPEDCLIIEDSPHGLKAAQRANAKILRVKNPESITIENIENAINMDLNIMNTKWQDRKMNVLIPMAGAGSRFEKAGYKFPKPLIDVRGKPMIQRVVENLNLDSNYIFITQSDHRIKYNLDTVLNLIAPSANIIDVNGITEGAACTTLLAKDIINNNNPLIIANSDQLIDWDSTAFMYKMQEQDLDAGILTFYSENPKWSFAKIDDHGLVTEVAEKNPISNIATVGIYFWKKGSDYVKYAERMIEKNIRVNNEFYVCPVFNEAIIDGLKIKTFNIEKMHGIGTPEDLDFYLQNN